MKKSSVFAAIIVLTGLLTGCGELGIGSQTAAADIRYRVFEIPRNAIDEIIPTETRAPVAGSNYTIARTNPSTVKALANHMREDSGLMVDHSRRISFWPRTADTWAYSTAEGKLLGGSTGAGFLGVRNKYGKREIRIEYDLLHDINTGKPLRSQFIYEGAVPPDGVLIAMNPFGRTDGTELVHLIAFEIENWE
jgi:hypothetical protein